MANTDNDGQLWAAELVERVGREARRIRGKRSAKWLSDKTAELGMRISPTVIAKLDSGHRGANLSVPEWLVISQALGVAPVSLLFPALPDGEVRKSPAARSVRSIDAVRWVSGEDIAGMIAVASEDVEAARAYQLLDLSRSQEMFAEGVVDWEISDAESADEEGGLGEGSTKLKILLSKSWEQNQVRIRELGGVIEDGGDDG